MAFFTDVSIRLSRQFSNNVL